MRKATEGERYALIRACMGSSDGDNVAGVADFSGTNGDREAQNAVFASHKSDESRTVISGDEFWDQVDETEYSLLDGAQRSYFATLQGQGTIDIGDVDSEARTAILEHFPPGSNTLTNLQTAFQVKRSVWEWACDQYGPTAPPPVPGNASDPLDPRLVAPRSADIVEAWI